MTTLSVTVLVGDACGLHLRLASALARAAGRFEADVRIDAGGGAADAKSPLALLTLGATAGTRLTVTACGSDAAAAIQAVVAVRGMAPDTTPRTPVQRQACGPDGAPAATRGTDAGRAPCAGPDAAMLGPRHRVRCEGAQPSALPT